MLNELDDMHKGAEMMRIALDAAALTACERKDTYAVYAFVKAQMDIDAFARKMAKRLVGYY